MMFACPAVFFVLISTLVEARQQKRAGVLSQRILDRVSRNHRSTAGLNPPLDCHAQLPVGAPIPAMQRVLVHRTCLMLNKLKREVPELLEEYELNDDGWFPTRKSNPNQRKFRPPAVAEWGSVSNKKSMKNIASAFGNKKAMKNIQKAANANKVLGQALIAQHVMVNDVLFSKIISYESIFDLSSDDSKVRSCAGDQWFLKKDDSKFSSGVNSVAKLMLLGIFRSMNDAERLLLDANVPHNRLAALRNLLREEKTPARNNILNEFQTWFTAFDNAVPAGSTIVPSGLMMRIDGYWDALNVQLDWKKATKKTSQAAMELAGHIGMIAGTAAGIGTGVGAPFAPFLGAAANSLIAKPAASALGHSERMHSHRLALIATAKAMLMDDYRETNNEGKAIEYRAVTWERFRPRLKTVTNLLIELTNCGQPWGNRPPLEPNVYIRPDSSMFTPATGGAPNGMIRELRRAKSIYDAIESTMSTDVGSGWLETLLDFVKEGHELGTNLYGTQGTFAPPPELGTAPAAAGGAEHSTA